MEEDLLSLISNAKSHSIVEGYDSNNNSYTQPANKRPRSDFNASSARFKGVVPQLNGHWGAQIYANHQRIWLGTFTSEKEAAMAYDSAAIKLRSGDSHRNFSWSNLTFQEPKFQNHYSTEAVLNMIKDGSYQSKFSEFLMNQSQKTEKGIDQNTMKLHNNGKFLRRQLFQKELTPSDVGKLNRLVIPKKYAVKFFPHISENEKENVTGGGVDDVLLVFYDKFMRLWKFRYCYWRSSQSFVFTRGWNRFVKEKNLEAKDIVTFYKCEFPEKAKEGRSIYLIDVSYNGGGESNGRIVEGISKYVKMKEILQKDSEQIIKSGLHKDENASIEENTLMGLEPKHNGKRKGLRLFGVQISSE